MHYRLGSLVFDLKTGIDLQFTGSCLIKMNTATVASCQSYQSPVKSLSTPSSCLGGAAILMHPAQRASERGTLVCGVFVRRRPPQTDSSDIPAWVSPSEVFGSVRHLFFFLFPVISIKLSSRGSVIGLSRIWGLGLIDSSVFWVIQLSVYITLWECCRAFPPCTKRRVASLTFLPWCRPFKAG